LTGAYSVQVVGVGIDQTFFNGVSGTCFQADSSVPVAVIAHCTLVTGPYFTAATGKGCELTVQNVAVDAMAAATVGFLMSGGGEMVFL
jgi:hypothetical protein